MKFISHFKVVHDLSRGQYLMQEFFNIKNLDLVSREQFLDFLASFLACRIL